jgi:GTP cyclohydrolase I
MISPNAHLQFSGHGSCGGAVETATSNGRDAADRRDVNGHAKTTSPTFDLARMEAAVRELLLAMGEDVERDGLLDTPRRVAKAYAQMCGGLREDPAEHLGTVFEQPYDDVVLLSGIEFHSLCEHHLLPFVGQAHVAYKPSGGKVVGLSKLARTVDVFARRPQVQERMTEQIADALEAHVEPAGVLVVVEAGHMCMQMRGIQKRGATMTTSAFRGAFHEDRDLRERVLSQIVRSS